MTLSEFAVADSLKKADQNHLFDCRKRSQNPARHLHAVGQPSVGEGRAFRGKAYHRQPEVLARTPSLDEAVLEKLVHDDADRRRIHGHEPAKMILPELAMLEQGG